MKKIAFIMMILTVLTKVFGFIKEIVVSQMFGASVISDSYSFAYSLPASIFTMIVVALVAGYIPRYARIREIGKEKSDDFTSNVLNSVGLVSVVLSILGALFTPFIVSVILPNASSEALMYIIPFVRISFLSMLFVVVIQVTTGYLQSNNDFLFAITLGFPLIIIMIVSIVLSKTTGNEMLLPWGITLSYALNAVILLLYIRRKQGFKGNRKIDFKDPNLKHIFMYSLPLIFGTSVDVISNLINQGIVSGVVGGMSYVNYATRIGMMIYLVFALPIINVLYPKLSLLIVKNKNEEIVSSLNESIILILLLVLPSCLGIFALSEPIITTLFYGGAFNLTDVHHTSEILKYLALGIPLFSIRQLFVRVCFGYEDMKSPQVNTLIMIIIHLVLGITLFNIIGVSGVAAALSISFLISLIHMIYLSGKKLELNYLGAIMSDVLKILAASLVMGFLGRVIYSIFLSYINVKFATVLSIGCSVLIYGILIIILKVDYVQTYLGSLLKKAKSLGR